VDVHGNKRGRIMKVLLLLLLSFNLPALEYSLEFSQQKTTMEWKGISHAKYDYNLKTLGAVVYHDSGFGVRTSYGRGRATLPRQGAAIPHLVIELKSAVDLELLYRHTLYDKTSVYWAVGHYWDHLPITSTTGDYSKDDWDNGWGGSVGIEHRMSKHLSAFANYRVRGVVGSSSKHNGALGSSHTSYGVGFKVIW